MKKIKPFIIGICGNSGCGKTALAERIENLLGKTNVLTISCDDYHKWGRGDKNWENFTHLNPRANNLETLSQDIKTLKSGIATKKLYYCHETGKFLGPKKTHPRKYIIFEGLHPFYTPALRKLFDFKIFLDIDPSLNLHFKIHRDVGERGHSKEKVLEAIKKREADLKKYILPQKKYADMVIEKRPILRLREDKQDTAVEYVFRHNKKPSAKKIYNLLKIIIPKKMSYNPKKDILKIPRILSDLEIGKIQKLAKSNFGIRLEPNIYCLSQLLISYNLSARGAKIGRLPHTHR